jgi:glycosyltransferase involved in cell wall biosynthesis
VWRVASSEMDLARYNWFSGLSYRVEALCAAMPGAIVANSHAGGKAVVGRGFPPDRVSVVWNGIRTDLFRPGPGAGAAFRRDRGLASASWLIGQVARSDPKKGWEDFIDAAKKLCDRRSDVRFLCVGVEPGDYGRGLKERAERLGIGNRITWCGLEQDIVSVYNALDINTLASRFGEGCPNAVGEAMACGVPCVVTDVGDAALVVGRREQVVPPGKPEALAEAWARLLERLESDRDEISARSRERIMERFGVERYVNETEAVLLGVR